MNNVPIWVTLLGFAAPLLALAGSAVGYVVRIYLDSNENRRNYFFNLMKFIDGQGTIAQKIAAVYELRRFPEHRDFIIRFCATQRNNISGGGAELLALEMDKTREYMEMISH